jgi:hypothetical protein
MHKKQITRAVVLVIGVLVLSLLMIVSETNNQTDDAHSIGSNTDDMQRAGRPARTAPAAMKEYYNDEHRLSFFYPAQIPVTEVPHDGAFTASFQAESGDVGFQLFAVPYREPTISKERFLMDVPSGVRTNERMIEVAGVQAAAFQSENAAIGETFEVWLIHNGYLYEFTTYRELGDDLLKILETVRFE